MELRETRELERNQRESLKDEDFAISSDEEEEAEGTELEDAKLNLGVVFSLSMNTLVRYR